MRKIAILIGLLFDTVAMADFQYVWKPALQKNITNAASGGSTATGLVKDKLYILQSKDEDAFCQFAATCTSGGVRIQLGVIYLMRATGTTLCCNSAGGTADIEADMVD